MASSRIVVSLTFLLNCMNHALATENNESISIRNKDQQRNIIVIEQLDPKLSIPENGLLDHVTIIEILHAMHENGILRVPTTSFEAHCFLVNALSESVRGIHTGQLFSIQLSALCLDNRMSIAKNKYVPLYILKETIKGKDEIKNLNRVSNSMVNTLRVPTEQLMYENGGKHFEEAQIMFDEAHFRIGVGRHKRYFSLLQTARGKSLLSYIKRYGKIINDKNTTETVAAEATQEIKKIFYRVGFAISKLHQKLSDSQSAPPKKTFIHGDFHAQNIFYDKTTSNISLIDNETFAMSLLKKTSGLHDIADLYILHTSHTLAHKFSKQLSTNTEMGINYALWHEIWGELFRGYISAFEQLTTHEKLLFFEYFRHTFYRCLSQTSIFLDARNLFDQRKLKLLGSPMKRRKLKNRYLGEVFINMKQELAG